MHYSKPPLTFADQADLLIKRGLQADPKVLEARLEVVNYYRLSGYLYPFRKPDDTYGPGTTLDKVWRRYTFDRRLRLLVLDAIERVEVAVRSQLVYEHAHRYGPFGYEAAANLPDLKVNQVKHFLHRLDDEKRRSSETFVKHFDAKYGSHHARLPIWIAAEIMSFGVTLTLYNGVEKQIRRTLAARYGVAEAVLTSWLLSLNGVRNICAHHARLWNRVLGLPPKIPRKKKHPDWHTPTSFPNDRVFAVLTILNYQLGIVAPQSQWPQRLRNLLDEYPDVPRQNMGFPKDWEASPIWKV